MYICEFFWWTLLEKLSENFNVATWCQIIHQWCHGCEIWNHLFSHTKSEPFWPSTVQKLQVICAFKKYKSEFISCLYQIWEAGHYQLSVSDEKQNPDCASLVYIPSSIFRLMNVNLIISSLAQDKSTHKVSYKSTKNFLSYFADRSRHSKNRSSGSK